MTKKKTGTNRKKKRTVPGSNKMKPATIVTMVVAVIALVVLVYLFYPASVPKDPEREYERGIALSLGLDFKNQGSLSFLTADGDTSVTIAIELANDDVKRRIGMMFREKMEEKQGMLFIFPYDKIQSFWMHNTVLPLDMIFINGQNEIVNIQKNTEPYSESSYFSTAPAKYVLEVNAGFSDKYNLVAGQKITWTSLTQ